MCQLGLLLFVSMAGLLVVQVQTAISLLWGDAEEGNVMLSESLVTDSQRERLRDKVFVLSVACPFDHGNPCACPLHPVRKMGVMGRFEWLHELSDPRLLDIFAYHQKCLEEKENLKKQGPG